MRLFTGGKIYIDLAENKIRSIEKWLLREMNQLGQVSVYITNVNYISRKYINYLLPYVSLNTNIV